MGLVFILHTDFSLVCSGIFWSGVGSGCPGYWWSHHPWRCSKKRVDVALWDLA